MTIREILEEALENPENYNEDGSVNWSFVDSDLWLHPDSGFHSDEEKLAGIAKFSYQFLNEQDLITEKKPDKIMETEEFIQYG